MCKWGTNTMVRVKIPAHLAAAGFAYRKKVAIDSCIAEIVEALQDGGIDMTASCCGHGKAKGRIDLLDGRILWIDDGTNRLSENLERIMKEKQMSNETKTVSDGHVYEPPACALCGASKAEHDAERRRRDEQMEFERMDWETTQEEGL